MSNAARRVALIAAVALAALAAGDAAPARGASFTVNAGHDAVDAAPGDGVCADAGGACTLRAAVEETNALPGADAIAVPAGEYPGSVSITDSLTIDGAGAAATTIRGPASDIGRVFGIACSSRALSITITAVSIASGVNEGGGGVYNCGHSLTLRAVSMRENSGSGSDGGAIYNSGDLTIFDSTITGNGAREGGAIYSADPGRVSILNSTISQNVSVLGNGSIRNASDNPVVLENVTLFETAAISGRAAIKNTIIADAGQGANCAGAISSLGHNLSSDNSCSLTGPGDLNGVEPQLTGLQNSGGQTLTHGLYPSSPAIDAGDNNGCPSTDQRGATRPQGAACDIGAYEYVPPPAPPPTDPPTEVPPTADPVTAAPTPAATRKASPSPSPSPTVAPSAAAVRRPRQQPTFAAVLVDAPEQVVEEDAGGGVSAVAAGLAAAGMLGLTGSAVTAGYFWHRKRRRPRLR